jgi:adenylate cyclase
MINRLQLLSYLILASLSIVAIYGARTYHALDEFESKTWDSVLENPRSRIAPDSQIAIIVIDQASLNSRAQDGLTWPWPREMYVPIIKFLNAAGARAIAFDMLFTEESSNGVDDDQRFAAAIRESKIPVFLGATSADQRESGSDALYTEQLLARLPQPSVQLHDQAKLKDFPFMLAPIQSLVEAGARVASVRGEPDSDGVYRHAKLGFTVHDTVLQNLPFSVYADQFGVEALSRFSSYFDDRGRLTIRFAGSKRSYPTYSYDGIVQSYLNLESGEPSLVNLELLKDRVVFFGVEAPGLLDLRPTPLAEQFPGVELNATIFDNLRNQTFVKVVSPLHVTFIAALFILGIIAAALYVKQSLMLFCYLLALYSLFIFGCYEAASFGYWFPMVAPLLGMTTTVIGSFAIQYYFEGRQLRYIRGAFKHYVSQSVVDQIVKDPSALALGGERRELTLFFSDIAGFTKISEVLEAHKLVGLLNLFLSEMTAIIMRHGGTVDKYVGDAIVAFWNAPLSVPDHAYLGVISALECQKRLAELRDTFQREYGVPLAMRVGLNTGAVSVGNFGSADRFNYTVVGDAANLASRLEGANKYFGTSILVAGATADALGGRLPLRRVATIKVVGRAEPVAVHEPLLPEHYGADKKRFDEISEAVLLFERGDLLSTKSILLRYPDDSLAKAYLVRINEVLEQGGVREGWNPVWNLTEK